MEKIENIENENDIDKKITKIFLPGVIEAYESASEKNLQLAHYTSATSALNIIRSKKYGSAMLK